MVDQLPVWGFVGEARKEGTSDAEVAYIYTHKVRELCRHLATPALLSILQLGVAREGRV
jgi:hypothetical protein